MTGEGIQDLLLLLVLLSQNTLKKRLQKKNELECHVLEVKVVERLGATIDVLLIHGSISAGDKMLLCGLNGPIITQIRTILTPGPLEELRVKGGVSTKVRTLPLELILHRLIQPLRCKE